MKKKDGKGSQQCRREKQKKWVSFLGFTLFRAMFTSRDFKTLDCKYLLVQNAILFFQFVSKTLEYFNKSFVFSLLARSRSG